MRYILILLTIYASLFIVRGLYAQTPTNIPNCALVPTFAVQALGISCGDSNSPCANKCCVPENPRTSSRVRMGSDLPVVGDVLKLLNFQNPLERLLEYNTQVSVNPCINGTPSTPGDLTNTSCQCVKPTEAPLNTLINMCANIKDGNEQIRCENCLKGWGQSVGVWTGVGCIRSNIGSFIQETLLGWGVGLAGGISMLCIMYAAFMMQTSGGEAEKIKKAQQLMTSCITGLMLIIFSVFILQLIGVRILRIPGFN